MTTHEYTFSFLDKHYGEITVSYSVSDELLLGIGFGVYIFNLENNLDARHESIRESGDSNLNLVDEVSHDLFLPENTDGYDLETYDEVDEVDKRYIIQYRDIYVNFDTPDFIQGINTAFLWLNAPELNKFTKIIHDMTLKTKVNVN